MESQCSSSRGYNDDSRPSALPETRKKGNGTDIFASNATEGPKCSSGFSEHNDECDVDSNDVLEDMSGGYGLMIRTPPTSKAIEH